MVSTRNPFGHHTYLGIIIIIFEYIQIQIPIRTRYIRADDSFTYQGTYPATAVSINFGCIMNYLVFIIRVLLSVLSPDKYNFIQIKIIKLPFYLEKNQMKQFYINFFHAHLAYCIQYY